LANVERHAAHDNWAADSRLLYNMHRVWK